jgi:hypothetical protein
MVTPRVSPCVEGSKGSKGSLETVNDPTLNGMMSDADDSSDAVTEQETVRAERWRRAILGLSENLRRAAEERPELSNVLMEAMHNALEQLLVYGEENEILSLEEWLELETADLPERPAFVERRAGQDRRQGDRRSVADRRSIFDRRGNATPPVFRIHLSHLESGSWIAEIPTLPGCARVGSTREEALDAARDAVHARMGDSATKVEDVGE